MSLTTKFREAAIEQSLGKNTVACYAHWHRQFFAFCRVPASQWDGELVRRWMIHLFDQNYSPVSRKQALCAVKFVFDQFIGQGGLRQISPDSGILQPCGFSPLDVPALSTLRSPVSQLV